MARPCLTACARPASLRAAFGIAMVVLQSGCAPEPRGLVAIDGGGPTEPLEVAGETRLVLAATDPAWKFEIPAGAAGHLDFGASVVTAGEATLRANVSVPGTERDAGCELHWSLAEAIDWKDCRIDIAERRQPVTVTLRGEGPASASIRVEVPRLVEPIGSARPVFVFLLDTVRLDALRTARHPELPGEEIERFSRDAWTFENARTTSSWTRTAVASLLTGARPATHGVYGRIDAMGDMLPVFPELFQKNGYRTIALSANPNVLARWGFARGFDRFVDVGAGDWAGHKTDAAELFEHLELALSAAGDAPALYYVHFMDAHAPYRPEPEDRAAIGDGAAFRATFPARDVVAGTGSAQDTAATIAPQPPAGAAAAQSEPPADPWAMWLDYLAEIRGLDREIGRFIARLKSRGLYEPATIVLVSDHGEEFHDHGGLFHGRTLYEEQLRVPLLLKPPGRSDGRRVEASVGIEDIAPTLASLLAIGGTWPDGRVRMPDDAPHETSWRLAELRLDRYSLTAAIDGRFKLILDHGSATQKLFDLQHDARETRDLASTEPTRVDMLRDIAAIDESKAASGWHLRFCGTPQVRNAGVRVSGLETTPRALAFEPEDHLAADGENWDCRTVLRPQQRSRELFGKIVAERFADEDELVLTPAEDTKAVLRSRGTIPFGIAFGTGAKVVAVTEVEVRAHRVAATLAPGDLPVCNLGGAVPSSPYLRLWYVAPRARLAGDAMDAGIEERLRGLGYLE